MSVRIGFLAAASVLLAAPTFAQQPAGDPDAGGQYYYRSCKTCHSGTIAPVLNGLPGRKVASYASFGGYSATLKAHASESWTDAKLDEFLKAPTTMAPECVTPPMGDAQQRADMIAFLKDLPPN